MWSMHAERFMSAHFSLNKFLAFFSFAIQNISTPTSLCLTSFSKLCWQNVQVKMNNVIMTTQHGWWQIEMGEKRSWNSMSLFAGLEFSAIMKTFRERFHARIYGSSWDWNRFLSGAKKQTKSHNKNPERKSFLISNCERSKSEKELKGNEQTRDKLKDFLLCFLLSRNCENFQPKTRASSTY
jgi:hypothetical protein